MHIRNLFQKTSDSGHEVLTQTLPIEIPIGAQVMRTRAEQNFPGIKVINDSASFFEYWTMPWYDELE
jgi:hypothetical protein